MIKKFLKYILVILISFISYSNSFSKEIQKIEIIGNKRISNETIILFSDYKNNIEINDNNLNEILKNLYETNFFKDISLKIIDDKLIITVIEESLVQTLSINGVKSDTMLKSIKDNLSLKSRSSFNDFLFKEDLKKIKSYLREQGYFFSEVSASIENLEDSKINLSYNILLGRKN